MRIFCDGLEDSKTKYGNYKIDPSHYDSEFSMEHLIKAFAVITMELRKQRHDFMNHLQVLHGYIQLNKTTELKAYVNKVMKDLIQRGEIFKISDPLLQGLFIAFAEQLNEMGCSVQFQIKKLSKGLNYSHYAVLDSFLSHIVSAVKKAENGCLRIFVKVYVENSKVVVTLKLPDSIKIDTKTIQRYNVVLDKDKMVLKL